MTRSPRPHVPTRLMRGYLAPMPAQDFEAWFRGAGWSEAETAARLGVSQRTVQSWRSGEARIPGYAALACHALLRGLGPWRPGVSAS